MMKLIRILIAVSVLLGSHGVATAQSTAEAPDLSLSDNIANPSLPKKAIQPIRSHMQQILQTLKPHYREVETVRDGEALLVVIPCSDLFLPNETVLKDSGKKYLRPFLSLAKLPTMYKILVAVYSDDTGEREYLDQLTAERADNIDEFLCQESGSNGTSIIPYGMGSDDPLVLNDTVAHRAENRRVEIFIIPEWQMIDAARSGKLK